MKVFFRVQFKRVNTKVWNDTTWGGDLSRTSVELTYDAAVRGKKKAFMANKVLRGEKDLSLHGKYRIVKVTQSIEVVG